MTNTAEVITQLLDALPPGEHGRFLREILGSVAACLVFVDGDQAAAEALYSVADQIAVLKS